MRRIAIMQGRLLAPEGASIQCFPRDRWREEFQLAAAAGLDGIEWIYDAHSADVNPLNTDSGVSEMRGLCGVPHYCRIALRGLFSGSTPRAHFERRTRRTRVAP